ncbi:MAG: Wzz/FepE/Etk N-terminal domain-containing protein, partial [Parafilimonas sp.]
MDFVYLLRVLLKRKWIIAGCAVIAAAIAWYFTKDDPQQYRSISQVSTGFTTNDVVKVNDDNNFFEADTKFNNAIVTFTSPTVMSLLSYSVILHDLQNPSQAFRELSEEDKQSPVYQAVDLNQAKTVFSQKLNSMSVLTSYKPEEKKLLEFLKLYGYDYNTLSNNLNVYRLERTDYIQIDYQSENPELSAFVVNNVFQDFVRYYRYIRNERSEESIDTLQSLLEKKKQDRIVKNQAIVSTGSLNIDDASKSSFDLISNLKQTLDDEQDKLTTNTIALRSVNNQLAGLGAPAQTVDNSDILQLRNQMNAANLAYLNSGSTDQNLLNKYNDLKSQYQNKIKDVGGSGGTVSSVDKTTLLQKKSDLEVNIEAEKVHIASLQSKIDQLQGNVSSQASRSAAAQSLTKDADLSTKEYLDILEKYNNAVDQNNALVNNFHQILLGQPAIEPEPSKKFMIIGMAGMAAFVCSVLIIVFLTYLDTSIKTPAIFSRIVNLRLLSIVNFMNLKNKDLSQVISNTLITDDAKEKRRNNKFRESLRKLRYEIENSGKKIFLFTSTKKGQGKTTLIQALSYSFSLSKKKILIIDTNFCNNDLTVQLKGTPVLEKIIADDVNDQVIDEIQNASVNVLDTGMIYVIGCSGGDYTPSEILPAHHLLQHLQKLTKVYDFIFLEGPPLNDFSDSKELTQYVDGVVAIFSA